jgi:glycosyltransferase involved in cell wall biosynthesis
VDPLSRRAAEPLLAGARTPALAVVIPVFDHETAVAGVLDGLAPSGLPCIVVDDGSSEVCRLELERLASEHASWVTLVRLPVNRGKGGAVMAGCREAFRRGYSHVLQVDADGQHDLEDLPKFRGLWERHRDAVICGAPRFDETIPKGRKYGRLLTSVWVWINTLSFSIEDAMCGYRIYPLAPLIRIFDASRLGRRMDFDPEILVRLSWAGVPVLNLPTRVRYPTDGRSHFRMLKDNVLISLMHARLFFGMLLLSPWLLARKAKKLLQSAPPAQEL